jgi:hypothetical protein
MEEKSFFFALKHFARLFSSLAKIRPRLSTQTKFGCSSTNLIFISGLMFPLSAASKAFLSLSLELGTSRREIFTRFGFCYDEFSKKKFH